jgi:hypothetical protein
MNTVVQVIISLVVILFLVLVFMGLFSQVANWFELDGYDEILRIAGAATGGAIGGYFVGHKGGEISVWDLFTLKKKD